MPKRKRIEVCSICMETPKNKAKLDHCGHKFCRKCIMKWSKTENSCPMCRKTFNKVETAKSVTHIYDKRRGAYPTHEMVTDLIVQFLVDNDFKLYFSDYVSRHPTDIAFLRLVNAMYHAYNDERFKRQFNHISREIDFAIKCITTLRETMVTSIAIATI